MFVIYYVESCRRLFTLNFMATVSRALIIGTSMVPVFIALKSLSLDVVLVLIISTIIYFLFIGILGFYTVYYSNDEWAKLFLKRK